MLFACHSASPLLPNVKDYPRFRGEGAFDCLKYYDPVEQYAPTQSAYRHDPGDIRISYLTRKIAVVSAVDLRRVGVGIESDVSYPV